MHRTAAAGLALLLLAGFSASAGAFSKDSLVWQKCTACHEPQGDVIPRVEEIRTTPEEWAVIVDRMARLHGMDLAEGEMKTLLKELCATQILSPSEHAEVAYLDLFNNPQVTEVPSGADEERLFVTCVRCHSAGKILSYRMKPANWAKLRDFHLYMDPAILFQMREMHWIDEADAVLGNLAQTHPYGGAWKAPRADASGSWLILGYEPGKGAYRGKAKVEAAGQGDYALSGSLSFHDGTAEVFDGEATLFGGYALRTLTRHNGFETRGAYVLQGDAIEGVHHFPAPNYRSSTSTWYRMGQKPAVLRVTPAFLLAGQETEITVEGMNLPDVSAADLAFDGGLVRVLSAVREGPEVIRARVVSQGAGDAVLSVKGLPAGRVRLAVGIDYIAVTPPIGRARLDGGAHYPPEGVQFEAIAYSAGEDASDPSDDVALGPVPATFGLDEYVTREGDDDLVWVGGIAENGAFAPTGDYAPIPAREYTGEGSGFVKVIAAYESLGEVLVGEGKLVVTVPDYIQRIK